MPSSLRSPESRGATRLPMSRRRRTSSAATSCFGRRRSLCSAPTPQQPGRPGDGDHAERGRHVVQPRAGASSPPAWTSPASTARMTTSRSGGAWPSTCGAPRRRPAAAARSASTSEGPGRGSGPTTDPARPAGAARGAAPADLASGPRAGRGGSSSSSARCRRRWVSSSRVTRFGSTKAGSAPWWRDASSEGVLLRVTEARDKGEHLRVDKGLNFPRTELAIDPLTAAGPR